MLEYNTMVYTCVEATSTLLYEFVEYVKKTLNGIHHHKDMMYYAEIQNAKKR